MVADKARSLVLSKDQAPRLRYVRVMNLSDVNLCMTQTFIYAFLKL